MRRIQQLFYMNLILFFMTGVVLGQEEIINSVSRILNVKTFGAVGDGNSYDTRAIQQAIDQCSLKGGGIVYFPQGDYLVGTLVLKSHVTLFLESQAKILGSTKLKDYHPHKLDLGWEDKIPQEARGKKHDFSSLHLIYAANAEDISIVGKGTIDGQGRSFWDEEWRPLDRPSQMIQFEACRNILIKRITLQNSPFWALHILGCDRVNIESVEVNNPRQGPNTDGIDVNSSSNVFISNCYVHTGDDCICLKSRLEDKSNENITVTNCVLSSDDSAIKLGTRSHGETKHCLFTNCVIRNSANGIALFMKDGGSYEDIHFSNITIETGSDKPTRPTYPIFMDLEKRTEASRVGMIRNVVFSNISINTRGRCLIGGLSNKPIEDLTFENIRLRVLSPYELPAKSKPRGVREIAAAAPGADFSSVPSHFIFVHVNGLTIRDLEIKVDKDIVDHERHAIWGFKLKDVIINGFQGRQAVSNGKYATLLVSGCQNVFISNCHALSGIGTFLRLEGNNTRDITVIGNDLSLAKKAFDISAETDINELYHNGNRLSE